VLELAVNHDGRSYELGTVYGHVALAVDDLDHALAQLAEQGIEPEREPYRVRAGGSRICVVQRSGRSLDNIELRQGRLDGHVLPPTRLPSRPRYGPTRPHV
jgi:hypothetical protein